MGPPSTRCRSPSSSSTSRGWLAITPSILRVAGYHPLTLQIAELLLDKESEGGERRPEWAPLGIPWGPGPYIYAMAVMSGAYMPGAGVVGREQRRPGPSL